MNERAARQFWGTTAVLDRRFSLGDTPVLEVVAIVRDDGRAPRVFRALRDDDLKVANVLIRTSLGADAIVDPVRSVLSNLSRDHGFVRVTTLREASTGPLTRITGLALAIAALVLSLATIGLYGSISFATSQRTREIAIRMAVGAPAPAVLRLVAREGVLVVTIGSLIGLALIGVAFRFRLLRHLSSSSTLVRSLRLLSLESAPALPGLALEQRKAHDLGAVAAGGAILHRARRAATSSLS